MRIQLNINIGKQHFYFLVILTAVLFVVGVNAAVNTGKTVGHDASEVVPGMFGGTGDYAFPNNLNITQNLYLLQNLYLSNNMGLNWLLSGAKITSGAAGIIIDSGTLDTSLKSRYTIVSNNLTLGGVPRDSWPEGVPSGFCVFSSTNTTCPFGWSRATQFDTRTIRGVANPTVAPQTGGSSTHTHSFHLPGDTIDTRGDWYRAKSGDFDTNSASSWPPYRNVLICCKI